MRTSLEHNERLNLIGALCITPGQRKLKVYIHSYRRSIRGDQVVLFLKHLARVIAGPMVIVWDKHPIHRRCQVTDWLARHPRFHVYEFPTSAPELNPLELAWTQISEATASTAPHNGTELRAYVYTGIARIRRSQKRLWSCIFGSDLPWKR